MLPSLRASAHVATLLCRSAIRRPTVRTRLTAVAAVVSAASCGPATVAAAATCDLNATPSTFAAEVSGAVPGQTICLASGDYGFWNGTAKAITIRPQDGATPTMGLQFGAGAGGFTIDGGRASFTQAWGLQIASEQGPDISAGAHDIVIENTDFSVGLELDGLANSNIVFDHDVFHDLNGFNYTAGLHLAWTSSTPSGVTVENSEFRDMSADGIQTGSRLNILYNEFLNVQPNAAGGNESLHTDGVQLFGGTDVSIIGNFVHGGCEQGIDAFDGTSGNTVEDNVIVGCTAHSLVMGGDKNPGSLVSHNTVVGGSTAVINCSSKPGEGPSTTSIVDNIASGGIELSDLGGPCQPTENTDNLLGVGGRPPNLSGTPRFVGGANPTTYAGFQLASGSPGKNAATDGLDVGARISPGPPGGSVSPPATGGGQPVGTPGHAPTSPSQLLLRSGELAGFSIHRRQQVWSTIRAFLKSATEYPHPTRKAFRRLKSVGFAGAAGEQLRGPRGAHGFSLVIEFNTHAGARNAARYLFDTAGLHAQSGRARRFKVPGVSNARGARFGGGRNGGTANIYWVEGRCAFGVGLSRPRRGVLTRPLIEAVGALYRRDAGMCS